MATVEHLAGRHLKVLLRQKVDKSDIVSGLVSLRMHEASLHSFACLSGGHSFVSVLLLM
jgi:hypothetical protein